MNLFMSLYIWVHTKVAHTARTIITPLSLHHSLSLFLTHTHTHTHTHKHTLVFSRTLSKKYWHTHSLSHIHTHKPLSRSLSLYLPHTHTHTHTHAHSHLYTMTSKIYLRNGASHIKIMPSLFFCFEKEFSLNSFPRKFHFVENFGIIYKKFCFLRKHLTASMRG